MYHQIDDQGQALKPPRLLQLIHATPDQAHLVRTELPAATPTAAEQDQVKNSKTWSFSWSSSSSAAADPSQHTHQHHQHHHRIAFQMERRDDGHMYYVEEGLGVYRVIPVEPPPQHAYSHAHAVPTASG